MKSIVYILVIVSVFNPSTCYTGVFWEITDIHLNLSYVPTEYGIYGSYKKDSSLYLLRSALAEMKKRRSNPDFIIVNGDNVYHGDLDFRETIQNVSSEVNKEFPNVPIFQTLGNHDVKPRNVLDDDSCWCEKLFDYWKSFLSSLSASEIKNFKKGCFYSRDINSPSGNLTVMALNTLLMYERNSYTTKLSDPGGQFQWMNLTLQQARRNKNKVFFLGHIPPGASEYSSKIIKHLKPKFNQKLLKIMQDYDDVIDAGFFSHQHTDAFKIVYNSKGYPRIPILQSPSITPYYLTTIGSVNPSFRLYFWDKTAENSYYQQFHTNIPMRTTDRNIKLNWTLEYSSTSLMPGLSAVNFDKLLKDFSLKNSIYFDSFFQYHLSGQPHDDRECRFNSYCRCQFICVMKHIDYSELDLCLNKCPSSSNKVVMIIGIIIAVIVLLILVTVLLYIFVYKRRRQPYSTPEIQEREGMTEIN